MWRKTWKTGNWHQGFGDFINRTGLKESRRRKFGLCGFLHALFIAGIQMDADADFGCICQEPSCSYTRICKRDNRRSRTGGIYGKMGEGKCWKQIGIWLSTFGVILIVIIQNSERAGFFKFSPVFLVRGIRMLSGFWKKAIIFLSEQPFFAVWYQTDHIKYGRIAWVGTAFKATLMWCSALESIDFVGKSATCRTANRGGVMEVNIFTPG